MPSYPFELIGSDLRGPVIESYLIFEKYENRSKPNFYHFEWFYTCSRMFCNHNEYQTCTILVSSFSAKLNFASFKYHAYFDEGTGRLAQSVRASC